MQSNTVGLHSFAFNISEGSVRGINVNICSFIFTEKGRIAQRNNAHLFSRKVSSGQCISFEDLLIQCNVPVSPPGGLPLLLAARSPELPSRPTTLWGAVPPQRRAGKDAANVWWCVWRGLSVCMSQQQPYRWLCMFGGGRVKHLLVLFPLFQSPN